MRVLGFLGVAAMLGLLVSASASGARGADPSLNAPYAAPDFSRWQQRFESAGREVYDRREEIVAALGLKPGVQVADVGAGTGLFTLLFAQQAGPAGKVYAVDIARVFVENIVRRAREAGLRNVVGIVNRHDDSGLAPASVDVIFVCDTYHHLEDPQAMLASMRAALRPGGRLAVIDYERIEGHSSNWVLGHVRAGREAVVQEITAAGFVLVQEPNLLQENFYLIFERSGDGLKAAP